MNIKLTINLSFLTLIILATVVSAFGQGGGVATIPLAEKIITIHAEKKCFGEIFAYLMIKYDVAFGFEESTLDRDNDDYSLLPNLPFKDDNGVSSYMFGGAKRLFTVHYDNGRLENILNDLVSQAPNYTWEISDDVVNIYPIRGRDSSFRSLLNSNVGSFYLKKGKPVGLIRTELLALPEFGTFLKENGLFSSPLRGDLNFINRPLPSDLIFSNLTFRELLNKIAKSKRGGWILKQSDVAGSKEKIFIDIQI